MSTISVPLLDTPALAKQASTRPQRRQRRGEAALDLGFFADIADEGVHPRGVATVLASAALAASVLPAFEPADGHRRTGSEQCLRHAETDAARCRR